MRVLILGTGSTIGTLGKATDAKELGVLSFTKRLSRVRSRWRDEYPALARVIADCASENLDQIWTHLDYTVKLQRSLGGNPYEPETSGELHRALLDAYSLTEEIERIDVHSDFALKTELMRLREGDVLVSFNWDTIGERIATDLGKGLASCDGVIGKASVNLVKPHGSLSWEDGGREDRVKWHDNGQPLLIPMRVDAVHPPTGGYMQPLVLGAVPMKERLIAKTQDNRKIYEVFADQWAAVVNAIAAATTLTVIGYRFPSEDGYGRFLLKQAAKRRATPLSPVSYYALKNDDGIEEALRDIFGTGVACDLKGPATAAALKP